jgi:hypothetical protein
VPNHHSQQKDPVLSLVAYFLVCREIYSLVESMYSSLIVWNYSHDVTSDSENII